MTKKMNRRDPDKTVENQTGKYTKQEANRQKKRIFRRILLALAGVILGMNLYLANAGTILGNKLPMPFGYGLANVLSGSMEPTFSKGALLLVKDTRQVQEGDIVVYQSGKELIVHRIVSLNGEEVITQGDANNVADEPFEKSQIKGKVIGWVPMFGGVAALLKTPAAVIMILLLAFLLVEGSFRKQKDADDQELDAIKEEIRRLKTELEETEYRKNIEKEEITENTKGIKEIKDTDNSENTENKEEN